MSRPRQRRARQRPRAARPSRTPGQRWPRSGLLAIGCALLALAPAPQPAAAGGRPERPPILTRRPTEFQTADGRTLAAEVGRLQVPENRSDPGTGWIELAVVRLRSTARRPGPPILFLHGGPGGSATHVVDDPRQLSVYASFLPLGDLVLLDQRGCGSSRPNLTWDLDRPLPADLLLSRESFERFLVEASREQSARFRAQGIDLAGYTTRESAGDVDALRRAMGWERIRLIGDGAGAHLALAVIRRYGEHIESTVLIGVTGPDHMLRLPSTYEAQLRKISWFASRDERVGAEVPDMRRLLARVLARLEERPATLRIREPRAQTGIDVAVGAFGLQVILAAAVDETRDIPVLPRLLHALDGGDTSVLRWFVERCYGRMSSLSAVRFTMVAAAGASAARRRRIAAEARDALLGDAVNLDFRSVNAVWNPPDLGEGFRSPVVSDVRTLFLSGSLDAHCPPSQADEVRAGFTDSTHLVIEHAGHDGWKRSLEVFSAMRRHLAGEDVSEVQIIVPRLRFVPLAGYDPRFTHPSVPEP